MELSQLEKCRREIWPELLDPDFPEKYEVVVLDMGQPEEKENLTFIHNDGGREEAGFKGSARDCVTRSIAIITGLPYKEVYKALAAGTGSQRASKRTPKRQPSANNGINTKRKWFKEYMQSLGFTWHPTLQVGKKTRTRLNKTDLPDGKLVVALSKHYTAVDNGQLLDTFDCSKNGNRIVLGYWKREEKVNLQ